MTSISDNKTQAYLKGTKNTYSKIKNDIRARLSEFKHLGKEGSELDIFCELAFCLFTPQSKAKNCCASVESLVDKDLILNGSEELLCGELNYVRFKYTKAKNLILVRDIFQKNGKLSIRPTLDQFPDPKDAREWLVENVRGMGYKEASHFLRNIGKGEHLAILDRHILKNLVLLGMIDKIPRSMSPKKYLEIESKMTVFAEDIKIPMEQLDLLLWYKETGEIFK